MTDYDYDKLVKIVGAIAEIDFNFRCKKLTSSEAWRKTHEVLLK